MSTVLRAFGPYLLGALLLAAAGRGINWYGAGQRQAGYDQAMAAVAAEQAAIERGMQERKDREDAINRGAVLARQAVEEKLSNTTGQLALAESRIDGLLQQHADRAKASRAGSGFDAAGPDWRGVFGECVARLGQLGQRAGHLGQRLGAVGKDAARWADQVNGLEGYARAIQRP